MGLEITAFEGIGGYLGISLKAGQILSGSSSSASSKGYLCLEAFHG